MQSPKMGVMGVCLEHQVEEGAQQVIGDEVREKTGWVSVLLDKFSSAIVISWGLTLHSMGSQLLVVTPHKP